MNEKQKGGKMVCVWIKIDIMVVKKDQKWNSLVKSLEKRLKEEAKSPTKEPLNAVEVICSHEDIERTRQG
jgi:hypothetical protein